jgi:transcription initiation factor TFIID subunit TAF12
LFAAELDNIPSEMPTEHQQYVEEQYEKFMAERQKQKKKQQKPKQQQQQQQQQIPKEKGFSPMQMGMKRSSSSNIDLTEQV